MFSPDDLGPLTEPAGDRGTAAKAEVWVVTQFLLDCETVLSASSWTEFMIIGNNQTVASIICKSI